MPLSIPKALIDDMNTLQGELLRLLPVSDRPNEKGEITLNDKNKDVEIVQRAYNIVTCLLAEIDKDHFKNAESWEKYLGDQIGFGNLFKMAATLLYFKSLLSDYYALYDKEYHFIPIVGPLSYQAMSAVFDLMNKLLIQEQYSFEERIGESANFLPFLKKKGRIDAAQNWKSALTIGQEKLRSSFSNYEKLVYGMLNEHPGQTIIRSSNQTYIHLYNTVEPVEIKLERYQLFLHDDHITQVMQGNLSTLKENLLTAIADLNLQVKNLEAFTESASWPKVVLLYDCENVVLFRPRERVETALRQSRELLEQFKELHQKTEVEQLFAEMQAKLKDFLSLKSDPNVYQHQTYVKFSTALQSLKKIKESLFTAIKTPSSELQAVINEYNKKLLPAITQVEKSLMDGFNQQKLLIFQKFQGQLVEKINEWKTSCEKWDEKFCESLLKINDVEQAELAELSDLVQGSQAFFEKINLDSVVQNLLSLNQIPVDVDAKNLLEEFKQSESFLGLQKVHDEKINASKKIVAGFSDKIDQRRLDLSLNNAKYIETLQGQILTLESDLVAAKHTLAEQQSAQKKANHALRDKQCEYQAKENEVKELREQKTGFEDRLVESKEKVNAKLLEKQAGLKLAAIAPASPAKPVDEGRFGKVFGFFSNFIEKSEQPTASVAPSVVSNMDSSESDFYATERLNIESKNTEIKQLTTALANAVSASEAAKNAIVPLAETLKSYEQSLRDIREQVSKSEKTLANKQLELKLTMINKSLMTVDGELVKTNQELDKFVMPNVVFIADPQHSFSEQWSVSYLSRKKVLESTSTKIQVTQKAISLADQELVAARKNMEALHESLETAQKESADVRVLQACFNNIKEKTFPKIVAVQQTASTRQALLRIKERELDGQLDEEKTQGDKLIRALSPVNQLLRQIDALGSFVDSFDYSQWVDRVKEGNLPVNDISDQDQFYIDAQKQITEFQDRITKLSAFTPTESVLEKAFFAELTGKCWGAQNKLNKAIATLKTKKTAWDSTAKDSLIAGLSDPHFMGPTVNYFGTLIDAVHHKHPVQPQWILDILKGIALAACPAAVTPESHLIAQKNRAILVAQSLIPKLTTVEQILALHDLVATKHQEGGNPYAFIRQERDWFRGKYGNTHTWQEVILPIKQRLKTLYDQNPAKLAELNPDSHSKFYAIMHTTESRSCGLFPYKSPISEGWEKVVHNVPRSSVA
jgi:hypothetical protein